MKPEPINPEQLRAQIRELVVAAVKRLEKPAPESTAASSAAPGPKPPQSGKLLLVLFTSTDLPSDAFFAQLATIAEQGFQMAAILSFTFTLSHKSDQVLARLSKGTIRLSDAVSVRKSVPQAAALVAPFLSSNSAAKLAAGITDTLPTIAVSGMLHAGKPVCFACDAVSCREKFARDHPAAAPALARLADEHLNTLQQMGVQLVGSNGLTQCLRSIPEPQVNLTSTRLAKQRVTPKRQFITAEDVWAAHSRGQKEIVHPRTAVVTDQAREYAAARGIVLTSE